MNSKRKVDSSIFSDNLKLFHERYIPYASFNAQDDGKYLLSRVQLYMDAVNEMRKKHYTEQNTPIEKQKLLKNVNHAFAIYFKVHTEVKEFDFDGGEVNINTRPYQLTVEWIETEIKEIYSNTNQVFKLISVLAYLKVPFWGTLSALWDIRFTETFLQQIQQLEEQLFEVFLFYLSLVRRGILFLHKYLGAGTEFTNWVCDPNICYSLIFCEALTATKGIAAAIMPERIPVMKNATSLDQIGLASFTYRQYILFSEIGDLSRILNTKKQYNSHKIDIKSDQDKYICFLYDNTNVRNDLKQGELYLCAQYKHIFEGDVISMTFKPLVIQKWMLHEPPVDYFTYNQQTRRWVQTTFVQENKVEDQKNEFADINILNRLENEKETQKLTQILDMLPTLKIKLSELQQNVVKSNQNLLCLGRSGTGKTTTSVLRLFAQEILYKILEKQQRLNSEYNKKLENYQWQQKIIQSTSALQIKDAPIAPKREKVQLHSTDIDQNTGTRLVFITASPVLTNEVMRFYKNLKRSLKSHLQVKEQQKQLKNEQKQKAIQEEIKAVNQSEFQDINQKDAAIEEIKQEENKNVENNNEQHLTQIEDLEDQEKRELLDFIRKEENQLIEDQQVEGQFQLPNAYNQLKPHHFPLFVTVKRLVYMMDANLSYSFFSRDNKGNIVGLDSNLGWHNESKGVMLINHYYKENINYDDQIAKFGKELMELEKDADLEEDDDSGENFYISEEQIKKQQAATEQGKSYSLYKDYKTSNNYILERQQLSFEVDYDVFEQKFWPKIAQKKSMKVFTPTLVWTEIYSVIKGGHKSNSYYLGYISKESYIKTYASSFLTQFEKKTIYYIFLEYEKWKDENNAYDFMDVITHVQKRLWYGDTFRKMKIDFLMVDEVQDLTPKTVQLLLQLTFHNVFFSGDTAQTIAKGVGARFLDLRHIFSNLNYDVPKIVQLTKNYRSHQKILELANSVVDLIELFFPKTIDKLQKEESDYDGMKPLIIMPLDNSSLRNLFMGTSIQSQSIADGQSTPQFGCNQVLIVRDQDAKAQIPDLFKNMLCLTVYEAKGLEFDDLILYNFFHLGDVSKSQWKLLNDIVYETVKRVKYSDEIQDFNMLDAENFEKFQKMVKESEKNQETDFVEETQLGVKRKVQEIYRKYSMLCIELKFLYVAVTRPKRRLIIYDDEADGRRPIQNYWEKLGLVDIVTRDMLSNAENLKDDVKNLFFQGALSKERSSDEEWRIQGIKLFKKKYYDSAIVCFQYSQDDDLVKRCRAYKEADQGSLKQSEADAKVWRAQTITYYSKLERKKMFKEAKKIRNQSEKHFERAGFLFESINMTNHAASCFYTAKNYVKAANLFEGLKKYGQAAECLMLIENYSRAAQLYESANLISLAIECYETAGLWESLLHCLHRNKNFFKAEEKESLVNKYVPVALNNLYKLYSEDGPEDDNEDKQQLNESNRGKMQEMKIKMKYQKKVNVIMEDEDEEEDSSDENEENQEEENKEEEQKENAQEGQEDDSKKVAIKQENEDDDIEIVQQEEEPELLEEIFQLKKHREEQEALQQAQNEEDKKDDSFEVIDTSTTKKIDKTGNQEEELIEVEDDDDADQEKDQKEGEKLVFKDDFEHLSQYDPDDEFLRSSKSVSIIGSILSKQSISQTSEFSIVTTKQAKDTHSLISISSKRTVNNVAVVESNRDIYAEDVITQKIIYYVSLFSEEVLEHLQKIRSKNVLFSKKQQEKIEKEELKEDDFLIDLDDVDNDFVNLILDALEYYELFRLCLMICNRYHMSDRLGRYVVSVCSKYSNLHMHRFNMDIMRQSHFNNALLERQRMSSIIAHEAIHNVFSLINPKFLALKDYNETTLTKDNSLGIESYRLMMDLGFWKKLVYIISGKVSLQLCNIFFERDNFETLLNFLEISNEQDKKYVKNLQNEVNLRNLQLNVMKQFADVFQLNDAKSIFNEIFENYKGEKTCTDILKLLSWIYSVQQTVDMPQKKNLKNVKDVEEQQIRIYQNEQLKADEVLSILQENVFDKMKELGFTNYVFAFQLLLSKQPHYFQNFIYQVRNYFDSKSLIHIINVYIKALQIINLETSQQLQKNKTVLKALYSVYLISDMNDSEEAFMNDESQISVQNIFKQYKNDYLIVNRSSLLIKDIMQVNQNLTNKIIDEFIAEKLVELKPKYYRVKNFNQAFTKAYNTFIQSQSSKQIHFLEKNSIPFILDMDAQFIMVPKLWILKLLAIKLLQMSFSLQGQLQAILKLEKQKQESRNTFDEEEEEEEEKYSQVVQPLESRVEDKVYDLDIMTKLNKEQMSTIELQDAYRKQIISTLDTKYNELLTYFEYNELLTKYWKKINLSSLNFENLGIKKASANKTASLKFVFDKMNLKFDLGVIHQKQQIKRVNQIVKIATDYFNQAFQTLQQVKQLDKELVEDENFVLKRYRLQKLLQSLQLFILIDKYEYMIELIKSKKKSLRIESPTKVGAYDSNLQLLKNFMIAVDIHVYMKFGVWSSASTSIYSFIKVFNDILDIKQKVVLLENAFYLVQLAKLGKGHMPDYILQVFDVDYNINQYYVIDKEIQLDLKKQTSKQNFQDYQGDSRILIDLKVNDKLIEKIENAKEEQYIAGLEMVVKLLKELNAHSLAGAHKSTYKKLYNMLIAASVNESKKSQKVNNLIMDGFQQIVAGQFDEFFLQTMGLANVDYESPKGITQLFNEFFETEDEFKWEFFASSKNKVGQYLAYVDVTQSQTKDAQKIIFQNLDKAFFTENKAIASHIYLALKLKKLCKKRKSQQSLNKEDKNLSYEDRIQTIDLGISKLLQLKREIPNFKEIINFIKIGYYKQIYLRQLIVTKYATNSQDLHYIVSKAQELDQSISEFQSHLIKFLAEYGTILQEYEDVQSDVITELQNKFEGTKTQLTQLEDEMSSWMERKAEPNLIEVERKNQKFKLKWQQLNQFEKRQRIRVLRQKQAQILGSSNQKQ